MLIRQARIAAINLDNARLAIRDKYGHGRLYIRECNIQPFPGLTWYEFCIELDDQDKGGENHAGNRGDSCILRD
jgi:hypothetical protein